MTIILYDNVNPFTECIATPLITVGTNYQYNNSNMHRVKTYTIRGKMKGDPCLGTGTTLFSKQRNLLNNFTKNFRTLQVIENGNEIINENNCIVKDISFDESSYSYLLIFTIQIDVYDHKYANDGIINPSDEISISNNENGTQRISRSISCVAINNGNYIDNAINFIRNRPSNPLIPSKSILISRQERINRFSGECSITEEYLYDPKELEGASNKGVITYSLDTSENDGEITVSVSGEITGGLSATITDLRQSFDFIDWHSVCLSEYNANFSSGTLENSPQQFSVTENITQTSLSFSIRYSNKLSKDAYIIDSTTVSTDLRTGIQCLSIELIFKCDYGCKNERLIKINNLKNSTNIDTYFSNKWSEYATGPIPLYYKSIGFTQNDFEPSISIQRSYCSDSKFDCGCLKGFSYTMNFSPPITQYSNAMTIDSQSCHYTQNLNYKNRFRFTISGQYHTSRCCTQEQAQAQLLGKINFITSQYFPAIDKIIEDKTIEETEFGTTSFSFTFNGLMDFNLPPTNTGLLVDTVGGYILLKNGWRIKIR